MEKIFKEILLSSVYDVAAITPLDKANRLSDTHNNEIFVKREDMQPVFSFKIRGAYNRISRLTKEERENGVICASAGNHAQGVAYSCKKLGIKATIVMPCTTPNIKIDAVKSYGAEVILFGDSYSDAGIHCQELSKKTGAIYIHPFDDPLVIAGQGTIGKEILEECAGVDAIFVPVGGGGLIAGIACYVKTLCPHVKIIGVEPDDSDAMHVSIQNGRNTVLEEVGIFAEGV
ncbi:MAG: pyridoxal-phosphate dependent enzyme, partial [Fibrobacteres bacterium]|nr:pyridoxal-phosphate dependent enzyme [Fibrobacterota bacterium]